MDRRMSVADTSRIMARHGMELSPYKIRRGIDAGILPFGAVIQGQKRKTYWISQRMLLDWI